MLSIFINGLLSQTYKGNVQVMDRTKCWLPGGGQITVLTLALHTTKIKTYFFCIFDVYRFDQIRAEVKEKSTDFFPSRNLNLFDLKCRLGLHLDIEVIWFFPEYKRP